MIRIGKIVATHGLQGAVVCTHIVGSSNWLNKGDVLFVELRKESYIPFFVSSVKVANDEEFILNVEDIDSMEAAKKLVGKQVYVKEDILADAGSDSPLLWIGFNMVDKEKGSLGAIEDVYLAGAQWLARLTMEGKEVLVPLVDDIIIQVNVKNKFVRVDLPPGLIDVYLE